MVSFNQGDIIKMNFTPNAGHEQQGLRPGIVISNNILNARSQMIFICPITNINKNHPFRIPLDHRTKTTGVILCEQAKMLDVVARKATFVENVPDDITKEVVSLIKDFL